MKQLILKDLSLFFKDKRSLLLGLALPIALITLFAFAFGGAGKSDNDSKVQLMVSDLDQTAESRATVKILDTLKGISLQPIALRAAQTGIKNGKYSAVLILHKGFSDSLKNGADLPIELQYDQAKEMEIGLLQQSLIPTLVTLPFSIDAGNAKQSMAKRFARMVGSANPEIQAAVQSNSDGLYDAIAESAKSGEKKTNVDFMGGNIRMTKLVGAKENSNFGLVQAVAGTSVMMLLFSVVSIGMGLLDEKEEGTFKRLLYTPLNPIKILFGKMIASYVIAVFQLVVMFVFATLVFGLELSSHLPATLLTILATAFACAAFGVFLASFAKTRQQVQGLSTLIILVMSGIGGSMIPLLSCPW